MKREELVAFVAEKADITKKAANDAVNAVFEGITSSLAKGDSTAITGFGSFKVVDRAAREGRNPSTGEKIKIQASRGVKFSVGAGLKKSVAK